MSTYAIFTPVKSIFGGFFRRNHMTAVRNTHKISIKMFQIHQRIFLGYPRNFRRLPAYGFTHAKVKKSIFNLKILELEPNIGITLNDF